MSQIQDMTSLVFDNYMQWKGTPIDIARPDGQPPHVSPTFRVLEYDAGAYHVFCTAGASHEIIPQSARRFRNPRGVRYEYLMHGLPDARREVQNALLMIAGYPFMQEFMYYAGCIIPTGGPLFRGSEMEYLYFTYPYEDDPNVFTPAPRGQIEREDALIQTLWVFPIHRSEARYVEQSGADAFEKLLGAGDFHAYDVTRPALA